MTPKQVKTLTDVIQAAAVPIQWDDARFERIALHVRTLPYEWAYRNVMRWAARPNTDERGRERPKYVTTVDDVLDACGVSVGARDAVVKAAQVPGAEVMVDLRSSDELTYVGPTDALPQGCYEYLVENKLPVPDRVVEPVDYVTASEEGRQRALAPPDGAAETKEEARATMASIVERLRGTPPARRQPGEVEARDLVALVEAHLGEDSPIYEATKRLVYRMEALAQVHRDGIAVYAERAAELEDAYLGADPTPEGITDAIVRLSQRLPNDHRGLLLDALVREWLPALTDARIVVHREDPTDDRTPIVRMVADFRRPAPPRVEEPKPRRPVKIKQPVRLGDHIQRIQYRP